MTAEPLSHELYRGISRAHRIARPAPAARGLRVLTYHSVGGALAEDPYGTSIDPALFMAHMTCLASKSGGWNLCALTAPVGEGGLRVAVTFDDGYKDTLTRALPVFEELDIPMTVFVATSNLSSGSPLYLAPSELKELASHKGVTIGAHGHRHVSLPGLSDADLQEDLARSKKTLEDLLGRPVIAMSYPFGHADRRVRDAARAAGFAVGCCSRYGLSDAARDPLLLCRTEIVAWDTVDDFLLKTAGHWDWYSRRHPDPGRI